MPIYNKTEIGRVAQQYGFVRDTFEKVLHIIELMQLTEQEGEYIDRFIRKEYVPKLLYDDEAVVERIRRHPMAIWKCQKM